MRVRPVPPHPSAPPPSVDAPWRMALVVGAVLAVLFTAGMAVLGVWGLGLLVGFLVVLVLGVLGGRVVAWEEARRWQREVGRAP